MLLLNSDMMEASTVFGFLLNFFYILLHFENEGGSGFLLYLSLFRLLYHFPHPF